MGITCLESTTTDIRNSSILLPSSEEDTMSRERKPKREGKKKAKLSIKEKRKLKKEMTDGERKLPKFKKLALDKHN